VGEHSLQVLGQPEIDITQLDDGQSLTFTAEVDVRPEITLPDLDGLTVQVDDAEVTDDDVAAQLDELRDRFGTLKLVDRPAEEGDYISLDLVTTVGGAELAEASTRGMSYVVGSADLVPGLDDAITGKSAGESATFTTTLAQGPQAGEEAEVVATVNSVKVKELPELDDDFAQLASEFDTVDELRTDLRERLGRVRVLEQAAQARDRLLEKLVETVDFPVPESAIKAEVDFRQHDVVHSLGHDDDLLGRFLESQGKTREEWDAEMRESAEKSVRAQFILDAAAAKSEVQIGDAELTEYLVRQAQRYQMPPQEFANEVVKSGNLPMLVADIRRNKALSVILESAQVTDTSGNPVDLKSLGAELGEVASAVDDEFDDDLDSDLDSDLEGDFDGGEQD
jgi:trigger factor